MRKNPDGLTLTSIAQLTGLHRHTATKYIYELKGAGVISERDVGSAKLCYLREGFSKVEEKRLVGRLNGENWRSERMKASLGAFPRKSSTGQVQILTVFLFLFLVPASIIIAQNATQNLNGTLNLTGNLILGNITLENATLVDNVSGNLTPIVNQTDVLKENITNETFQNITIPLENLTANGTLPMENTSANQTEANVTTPEINASESNESAIIEPQNPVLTVRIVSPDKVVRGEQIDISAVVTNTGNAEARNVNLSWEIPPGFEIVSGAAEASCGAIIPDSECTSSMTVSSSIATDIGRSELKVKVRYEK